MNDTFFSREVRSAIVRRLRCAHARVRIRGLGIGDGSETCGNSEASDSSDARGSSARRSSEAGDTLIEVLISALLVAVIAVGVTSGLNSTTKATALQRARSQADALAEQDEERLRSLPINKLVELGSNPESKPIKVGNTEYTVKSSATYIADSTATESCSSSAAEADYLQTTSTVSWNSLGKGKPVEETGIISPQPGANMIVQVTESGTAVPKATATVTELAPKSWTRTLETSAKGCAIFALPEGGEYSINVHKTGYVTPNGYENTDEDEQYTQKVYITAESTAKEGYSLGLAGKIKVTFSPNEGETFTIFNTGIKSYKKLGNAPHQASLAWFGTENSYAKMVETPTELYPFTTHYIVYAGLCEANKPPTLTSENEITVPRGGEATPTLALPSLKLAVYKGETTAEPLKGAKVTVTDEDPGCNSFKRTFETNELGRITHEGLPYGTYELCVSGVAGTPAEKRLFEKGFQITTPAGTEQSIYLGKEKPSTGSC
jgi:Tfp pilus assembly protein PilV